jgi:lysine-N-methylase
MTLPIRVTPILEHYDCRGCGDCCHGTIIPLREDDYERIRGQRWEERPEYRGAKIFVRSGLFKRQYHLAKRGDGSCVFLSPENRCRIHEEFGPAAKPLVCQIAPLQLVPVGDHANLTVRRYCRCSAEDRGRPLAEHVDALKDLVERNDAGPKAAEPPPIVRRQRRPWRETLVVTDAITRLMLDERYPLVRRLAHGLEFCSLLEPCRLERLEGPRLLELAGILEESAVREAGDLFQRRMAPGSRPMKLFRQTAMECLRLHPKFVQERSWAERWRMIKAAIAFARGRGPVPLFRLPLPPSTFESLERPLGHLDESVLRPLNLLFETLVASLRFAVLNRPGWSITESFRALALSYAVGMWVLRLGCGERAPDAGDAVDAAMLLDRGQGFGPLVGRRHRLRVSLLSRRRELARLVVWYAR